MRVRLGLWLGTLSVVLAGCASYLPEPLNTRPNLRAELTELEIGADQIPLPELEVHRFDPRRPLDMDQVAMIAVVNSPELKALRARAGVAEAQAFAAGLLPNPQLTADYGFLLGGPGIADAFLVGLGQEVLPILTLSTRKAAARASERSVKLDLLWQEWQTVSKARLLFVAAVSLERQRAIIRLNRDLFGERYRRSTEAMKSGNETLPTVTSDLVALNAAETALFDIDQLILKNKHDLNALLGLLPDTKLRLGGIERLRAIDAAQLRPLLRELAARRPDLLALRAGYDAQEEKFRLAIIEQFPKLNVGLNYAKDTSAIYTLTPAVTISLPIFDRNQGNIAIERASRWQLHEEFQSRLDTAYGAAGRLLSELRLTEEQYRNSVRSVEQLRQAVAEAEPAFRAGNLDERSFIDLRTSLLAKEITTVRLEQAILEQRVALQTLLGSRLPNLRDDLPRVR